MKIFNSGRRSSLGTPSTKWGNQRPTYTGTTSRPNPILREFRAWTLEERSVGIVATLDSIQVEGLPDIRTAQYEYGENVTFDHIEHAQRVLRRLWAFSGYGHEE